MPQPPKPAQQPETTTGVAYIDNLAAFFKEVVRHQETTELEGVIYPGKVDNKKFSRLLKYIAGGKGTSMTEQLDISFRRGREDYRIEISGRENVVAFIKGGGRILHSQVPLTLLLKGTVPGFRPIVIDACETRVKLKTETEVVQDRPAMLRILSGYKQRTYRVKKRFSVPSPDGKFRFDMTVVRSVSVMQGETVSEAGAMTAPQTYEVEIEYVGGGGDPQPDPAGLAKSLVRYALELKMAMDGEETYVPPSVVDAVLADFEALFKDRRFIGPNLVTLERNNLAPNPYNNDYVVKGYTVTDKADGERCLLYASSAVENGEVFKLTRNGRSPMRVQRTGMRAKGGSGGGGVFVLDCEHITRTASGAETSQFMVFDAYAYGGQGVGHMPLMGDAEDQASAPTRSRLACARAAAASIDVSGTPHNGVEVKRFYADDIFKGAAEILALQRCGKMKYYIDGLVYTPKALPVGALFDGDKPHFGGTWDKVFKWKPPRDNSIDFEVRFVGTPVPSLGPGGLPLVQRMDLYVGYQSGHAFLPEKAPGRISSLDALLAAADPRPYASWNQQQNQNNYTSRLFALGGDGDGDGGASTASTANNKDGTVSSVDVHVDPAKNRPLCKDGSVIEDHAVVEMVRDEETGVAGRWVPLRLRPDKDHGNDYNTAMNVWRSMCNPVDEEMVTGSVRLSADAYAFETPDVYYRRDAASWSRGRAASRVMRDFHNKWVKRMLLAKIFSPFMPRQRGAHLHAKPHQQRKTVGGGEPRGEHPEGQQGASVFDIACGKANDIAKYFEHGVTTIVGADKSGDNIENAFDGAYARVMDLRNGRSGPELRDKARRATVAFCEADFGVTVDNAYMDRVVDNDARAVMKLLWHGVMPSAASSAATQQQQPMLAPYRGIVRRRFDVVACQFAIHYFMSSKRSLSAFMKNVDNLIKPGGLFVGTCLDGRAVDRAFRGGGDGATIRGTRGGRLVWSVTKLYDRLDEDDTIYNNFGKKLRVFVETINQPIDEYVVDFDLLTAELATHDIVALTAEESEALGLLRGHTGTFRDVFDEHNASGNREFRETIGAHMTDEEKRYSFLNRWFVFKKRRGSADGAVL